MANATQSFVGGPNVLGVIGGSGVYSMPGLEKVREHDVTTPFGKPSDVIVEAKVAGRTVFFLPRHGKGHTLLPAEINYRANIYAMKMMGVTSLIAVSAVGIMKETIQVGDFVIPDQIFDRTKGNRPSTFFGEGVAGHVAFADPFCSGFSAEVRTAAEAAGVKPHVGGVYVCMEGPQFSTRAESHFYRRTLEPAVIGMTAIPESKLAREAEMCYSMLAMGTDYDCWHESNEDVSVEAVVAVIRSNSEKANTVVTKLAETAKPYSDCSCRRAAAYAVITAPDKISWQARERLNLLWGKYWLN